MKDPDIKDIENMDKEKALALASVFLSSKPEIKLPNNLRVIGNLIIATSALGFIFSFAEFYTKPIGYVLILLLGDIIMLVCAIGFRRAKKWAFFLFLCLYSICLLIYLYSLLYSGTMEPHRFLISNIVPAIFILTSLYNWRYFK